MRSVQSATDHISTADSVRHVDDGPMPHGDVHGTDHQYDFNVQDTFDIIDGDTSFNIGDGEPFIQGNTEVDASEKLTTEHTWNTEYLPETIRQRKKRSLHGKNLVFTAWVCRNKII